MSRNLASGTSAPNVSVIERSTSAPTLVSDASVADLQYHFKKCKCKNPNANASKNHFRSRKCSTNTSYSPAVSPRSCLKKQSLRNCVQTPADACECLEQLFFNNGAKRSAASSSRLHCDEECQADPCAIPMISTAMMTNIKKESANRSCSKNVKDSGGASLVDSSSATCDDANTRANYYHNKLLATLQILENKEETIRVQAESLAVAEGRIAALNDRANDVRRDLDKKTKEYQALLKSIECCKVEKNDVSITTDKPMRDQSDIVNTLQNNLWVIEDLYRECFYETAKQENLIEMLRSSYLDVRLMDRQKADHIGRLQTVISTQKWSLESCQDIALEVENLKMDISNFLHSSTSTNNDSGMWERSEESLASVPGAREELQDVREHLLRLQDLLISGCTCGLEDENKRLKKEIDILQIKLGELRGRICELECTLVSKNNADTTYKAEIESKEKELLSLRDQLLALEEGPRGQNTSCDVLTMQLRHTEALLDEKSTEVIQLQGQIETQAKKINDLQEELNKANQLIKENCKMRSEVSYLTTQVSLWRGQLTESERRVHALEAELARARAHCSHIDACYREKASNVAELQANLEEAHARGTALCGEARHAVCAVRHWMRRMRDKHRGLDNLVKEKDALLAALHQHLEERQSESQRTSGSDNTASCSKCLSSRDERSFCSKERREECRGPSTSEIPSCSSTPVTIRVMRKNPPCLNKRCKAWMCDAAAQEPVRRDAGSEADTHDASYSAHPDVRHVRVRLDRTQRDVSPTEQLLFRVEKLSEALADGHRRWTRPHDAR